MSAKTILLKGAKYSGWLSKEEKRVGFSSKKSKIANCIALSLYTCRFYSYTLCCFIVFIWEILFYPNIHRQFVTNVLIFFSQCYTENDFKIRFLLFSPAVPKFCIIYKGELLIYNNEKSEEPVTRFPLSSCRFYLHLICVFLFFSTNNDIPRHMGLTLFTVLQIQMFDLSMRSTTRKRSLNFLQCYFCRTFPGQFRRKLRKFQGFH